jgi:hypothetical protein
MNAWRIALLAVFCSAFGNAYGQTPTLSGNNPFTGNNTFGNINKACAVDLNKYPTIASALADSNCQSIYIPNGAYSVALGSLTVSRPVRIVCESHQSVITFTGSSTERLSADCEFLEQYIDYCDDSDGSNL